MKYIIYDTKDKAIEFEGLSSESIAVINASKPVAKCVGCFKCWLKNPGKCTFADSAEHLGAQLLTSEEIIIVCESLYGGFSVNIKALLDRTIPGVLPFFKKKNNELHHSRRYKSTTSFKAVFYNGDSMNFEERQQAEKMLTAVALNFYADEYKAVFVKNLDDALAEVTA